MPRSKKRTRRRKRETLSPQQRNELLSLYALKQLPSGLRSDVLTQRAPGEIASVSSSPVIAVGGHNVPRDRLLAAFRTALSTNAPQRLALKDASASVTVADNGKGAVRIRETSYIIRNVDLASETDAVRASAISRVIASTSLSADSIDRLRQGVSSPFSEPEFFRTLETIARSPESIAQEFSDALSSGNIPLDGFFSAHPQYLEQLLPNVNVSGALDEYETNELAAEFSKRIAASPDQAFKALSRLFASRVVVGSVLKHGLDDATLKRLLGSLVGSANPYALVGAVELCVALAEDQDYVGVGKQLLESLAAAIDRVRASMDLFAAVFCIALPRLRTHASVGGRPAFWRRLAATAHASLILEATGSTAAQLSGLLEWAIGNTGSQFFATVALEKGELSRWQPEWIDPRILLADLLGRITGIDGSRFSGWTQPLDDLRAVLEDDGLKLSSTFPSIMEASLPVSRKRGSADSDFRDLLTEATSEASVENVLSLRSLTYGYALFEEVPEFARNCMQQVVEKGQTIGEPGLLSAMKFSGDVARLANDTALADATVDALINAAPDLKDETRISEIVCLMVICSRVREKDSDETLVNWLMRLIRMQSVKDVISRIRYETSRLAELDKSLRPKLARVVALAALGES